MDCHIFAKLYVIAFLQGNIIMCSLSSRYFKIHVLLTDDFLHAKLVFFHVHLKLVIDMTLNQNKRIHVFLAAVGSNPTRDIGFG